MPAHTEVDLGLATPPAGEDPEEDFDQRSGELETDLAALDRDLRKLNHLLSMPSVSATTNAHMAALETRVSATRGRLAALAEDNKRVAKAASLGPASMRIRVTRFGKLAADFTTFLQQFEAARDAFRERIGDGIVQEVQNMGLGDRAEVDEAVREGSLEELLLKASPEMRYQVEDLRERNKAFEKLNRDVAQLHEMFVEMSYLTENQQTLINEIEHNVEEVQRDVEKADEEIVEARRHQKSANKKKMIIAAIAIALLIIMIVVLITQLS